MDKNIRTLNLTFGNNPREISKRIFKIMPQNTLYNNIYIL